MSSGLEATLIPGDAPALFLWMRPGDETPVSDAVAAVLGPVEAEPVKAPLALPVEWTSPRKKATTGLKTGLVDGLRVRILPALGPLARMPVGDGGRRSSASLTAWSLAAKLALELVARQRVVPWAKRRSDGALVRWRAAPDPEDLPRIERLAAALPPAARACTEMGDAGRSAVLLTADAALGVFLDTVADLLVRAGKKSIAGTRDGWSRRVADALVAGAGDLELRPVVDDPLVDELRRWAAPATGAATGAIRLVLRIELPGDDEAVWVLRFAAASVRDPSLQLEAGDVWRASVDGLIPGVGAAELRAEFMAELGRATRIWPRFADGLRGRGPETISLESGEVAVLIAETAPLLRAAGIEVRVPAELTAAGRQRLRMSVQAHSSAPAGEGAAGFGLASIVEARWEAMLDDEPLTEEELDRLARLKQPLVRIRGRWVLLDRTEVEDVVRRVSEGAWALEGASAIAAALGGEHEMVIVDDDPLARLRDALRAPPPDLGEIPGLTGRLRPYQRTGAAWLERLDGAALGGILADDMGLGKTVEVLAFLLRRAALRPPTRPHLLVCPTSVLGSWDREAARFAPSLPVYRHYGGDRATTRRALAAAAPAGSLCVTTYGLLRRDRKLLAGCDWETVVLDEAQAIKNPAAQVARAACALPAGARFALTGTPVENRLAELWSIYRFAVPGLLGAQKQFLSKIASPIERYRSRPALERLHRLTGPFLLRRTKSDPGVLPDLPPKLVVRASCPLTTEQATLYRAAVDNALDDIRSAEGIDRRGRVLALITTLKQICNHPEQILDGSGGLPGRSGKLDRIGDELEEVLAAGESALVFTQYRVMGDLLQRFVAERLAVRAPFLHGGVAQAERERMVVRFQDPDGPPVMVISLRAGGTGLTLTRASHVFHFDRWWNPAVEDQASDRAHRIGQQRTVVVHPMVCRGTLEERIDTLLESKSELAALAVRSGDAFITEFDDDQLEELVRLTDVLEEMP
jgi:hypothetical protein